MKQKHWIAILLFVLSTNVVACVKEEPVLPPATEEPAEHHTDAIPKRETSHRTLLGETLQSITATAHHTLPI